MNTPTGLYDPAYEHDACGVAFVARLDAVPSHETVERALTAVANLEHRGAAGRRRAHRRRRRDPHPAARRVLPRRCWTTELPPAGSTASRCASCRTTTPARAELEQLLADTAADEGQTVLGLARRPGRLDATPARRRALRPRGSASSSSPLPPGLDQEAFERKLYVIRRRAELAAGPELVIPSFSSKTVVYKGMLTAPQLPGYFPDLHDERFASALALVHSRYSTNTFPSWELAHPYRLIAHNGEINTLRGNVNWMRARESQLASELFGDDLPKVLPVVRPAGSDTANFDNVLELLLLAGRSLPHALMMMIPEAYQGRDDLPADLKGFYAYHQCLMEAWDGPAAIAFTRRPPDRRDARPQRPAAGTLVRDPRRLGRDGLRDRRPRRAAREHPAQGPPAAGQALPRRPRPRPDRRRRARSSTRSRRASRTAAGTTSRSCGSPTCPSPSRGPRRTESLRQRQLAFGYAQEDMKVILAPLARNAEEAVGSMGNDSSLAVLSDRKPLLYSYFKQLFAQVTNPPIDSIREAVVMSVQASVGSERNLLDETPEHARQLVIDNPILLDSELEQLRQVRSAIFKSHTLDVTWPVAEGPAGMERALERVFDEADQALADGANILDPLRPRRRARPRAHPVAARRLGRAPPSRSRRARACRRAS